jgi:hypothetical protein
LLLRRNIFKVARPPMLPSDEYTVEFGIAAEDAVVAWVSQLGFLLFCWGHIFTLVHC